MCETFELYGDNFSEQQETGQTIIPKPIVEEFHNSDTGTTCWQLAMQKNNAPLRGYVPFQKRMPDN